MNRQTNRQHRTGHSGRNCRTTGVVLALLVLPLTLAVGCGDEIMKEFRGAAVGSLETGVGNIADGIISGIFAVAKVDSSSTSSSSSSSSSSSDASASASSGS